MVAAPGQFDMTTPFWKKSVIPIQQKHKAMERLQATMISLRSHQYMLSGITENMEGQLSGLWIRLEYMRDGGGAVLRWEDIWLQLLCNEASV